MKPISLRFVHRAIAGVVTASLFAACTPPDPIDEIVGAATKQFEAGEVEKGFEALQEGLLQFPDSIRLGNVYRAEIRARDRQDHSIEFFQTMLEQPDRPPGTYFNLAFAYIDKIPSVGPMGAAFLSKRSIKLFQEVLQDDPENWIATYSVGMNYLYWPEYFKKVGTAISYLEKCVELQKGKELRPYHLLTYIRLGDGYARRGEVERAVAIWEAGLETFPDHPDLVGRLALERDGLQKAIADFYNPNKAIGTIDTDISILWIDEVPETAVPLNRPATQKASAA